MLILWLVVAILFIVITTAKFKLHPFLALIAAAIWLWFACRYETNGYCGCYQ